MTFLQGSHKSKEKASFLVRELQGRHGIKAIALQGDVSIERDVFRLFDESLSHFPNIDILVNNAAVSPTSLVSETSLDIWNKTFQTNLVGTFLTSREMVKRLRTAKKPGRIVNISSAAASLGSTSGRAHYDASKGGVNSFTLSLAKEVAKEGILVNGIAPGMIMTDLVEKRVKANMEIYLSRIPLGRIADPREIADVVVFLCSEKSGYMTGTIVNVSGGLLLG